MRGLWLKLWRRRRMQQDLEAELAFHREMAGDSGNSLPVGHIREEAYDQWRFVFVENLLRRIVYAPRRLRRKPAPGPTPLLSLAPGVCLETTPMPARRRVPF